MSQESRGTSPVSAIDADNKSEENTQKIITINETDFSPLFEKVDITAALLKDLKQRSVLEFIGFLIRVGIIASICVGLVLVAIFTENKDTRTAFLFMLCILLVFCAISDIIMQYPYEDVLWYSKGNIDTAYLAITSRKIRATKGNVMALILNDYYRVELNNLATYCSIDKGEPVLLLVKEDSFRVIGLDTLLGDNKAEPILPKLFR